MSSSLEDPPPPAPFGSAARMSPIRASHSNSDGGGGGGGASSSGSSGSGGDDKEDTLSFSANNVWRWTNVTTSPKSLGQPPCLRSLHVASVLNDKMYVFGGYDGSNRVNDFHEFDFKLREWRLIPPVGQLPAPRDRHVSVVYGNSFYVFAGFDGATRVNDFYEYSFDREQWAPVQVAGSGGANDRAGGRNGNNNNGNNNNGNNNGYGPAINIVQGGVNIVDRGGVRTVVPQMHIVDVARSEPSHPPPSPRHSHSAVIYGHSMYVFGGYDGSYRSDFHAFNFGTSSWNQVATSGRVPRARYRATCVVHEHDMYLFGGHDGTRHLNDVHVFDFDERTWTMLDTTGPLPIPRDSHVSVVHGGSMYVFGGSTGSAMNDFHELRLDTKKWSPVQAMGAPPGHRFCHVGVVSHDSMYVFGGYDGSSRLNDFLEFHFGVDLMSCDIPPSSLVADLRGMVNNDTMSDVTFIVEGRPVHAHKIMCLRCSYFRAMLTGDRFSESKQNEIVLRDVRYATFLVLLEYLYTDHVEVPLEVAMELFQAADQFGVERLKKICESKMLGSICVENAAQIFHAADQHNARSLREKTLNFILANFDPVTKTPCFEEMGRTNVDLVFEILQKR